jgi:dCMP deaminase
MSKKRIDFWMSQAALAATQSKDRSRKVGCVIVDERHGVIVSTGWNGFARGVRDDVEMRYYKPLKYQWTEHAERNAIYNAARRGTSTDGCSIYLPWFPCCDCARAIIQSGITTIHCVASDPSDGQWHEDMTTACIMLVEAGVKIVEVEGREAPKAAT